MRSRSSHRCVSTSASSASMTVLPVTWMVSGSMDSRSRAWRAPSVGAKIPAGLHPHTLPPPLLADMPVLKRYTYLKFKQQVLIIDPMSRKIVDMFPEASG